MSDTESHWGRDRENLSSIAGSKDGAPACLRKDDLLLWQRKSPSLGKQIFK